ncbi:MAG: hypothetical protein GC189_04545 [Alphaproteobacteria bacterium]|nr:hypothetical protein [Alphaproteobacteria bacterium]
MALHALCCGAPIAVMLLAAGLGAGTGILAAQGWVGQAHAALHGHEGLVLAVSAVLVTLGGIAEFQIRKKHRLRGAPVLFAVSVACLLLNVSLVAAHRMEAPAAIAVQHAV